MDLWPHRIVAAQGVACCDVVTRGLAYDKAKIFLVTLDNHVTALDAKTGKETVGDQDAAKSTWRDRHDGAVCRQRKGPRRHQRRRNGRARLDDRA